jgi:cell division cycle protein 20 (cofactor of APC complex)
MERMEIGSYLLSNEKSSFSIEEGAYSKLITGGLIQNSFQGEQNVNTNNNIKINSYKQFSATPSTISDHLSSLCDKTFKGAEFQALNRTLPQNPDKILDAPELLNDYYLNLLDWGASNVLAVCLGQSVYLWNAGNSEIKQLLSTTEADSYVSSVNWSQCSNYLAVGLSNHTIQIWDPERTQLIRTLKGHEERVSSLSWNGCLLSSGSRDTNIINHDVRMPFHIINKYTTHEGEVCGLKWSRDGSQLASGANDNALMIWDLGYNDPRHVLREHTAAVKALAWCPWQKGLLATGGGTSDKTMKFWNTETGNLIQSVNTSTQVCSLVWNKYDKEIASSHGFSTLLNPNEVSKCSIRLWKYPNMTQFGEIAAHDDRVLHLALSPEGETVVSAGADEKLCFWKLFENPMAQKKTVHRKAFMNDLR